MPTQITKGDRLISVDAPYLQDVINALSAYPKVVKSAIHFSIKDALRAGRTTLIGRGEHNEGITSRYNVNYNEMLAAIGNPKVFGMSGILNISGHRIPLSEFPNREIFPYGVAIAELKEGPPINILHAFKDKLNPDYAIYQRATPETPRYPIKWVMGLSVAEMAGEHTQVWPAVQLRMEEQLKKRLGHYIINMLNGTLTLGARAAKVILPAPTGSGDATL